MSISYLIDADTAKAKLFMVNGYGSLSEYDCNLLNDIMKLIHKSLKEKKKHCLQTANYLKLSYPFLVI
jgi:hypothetical protein